MRVIMNPPAVCAALLALFLAMPASAAKLVPAPPPPVLLDDELPAGALQAKDPRGRLLYENHCMGCHESVIHVRDRRLAKTMAEVQAQVVRWSDYLNLRWNREDIGEVTRYLNDRYYEPQNKPKAP